MKNVIIKILPIAILSLSLLGCEEAMEEIKNVNYPRPFSPTNVTTEITNQTNVSISWDEVENARDYVLELYQNDSLAFNPDFLVEVKQNIFPEDMPVTFTDLVKDINYSVRVKAIRDDNTESKWEGVSFKTSAVKAKVKEWNFSSETDSLNILANELGNNTTFEDVKTVQGLTLHAAAGKSMRFVKYDAEPVDDYTFSWYLDLQGGGTDREATSKNRCVSFDVTEPCIITIYANSAAGRILEAYTATEVIGSLVVPNKTDPPAKMQINWTGGKEKIYIRSQSSGINLYLIRVSVGEVYVPDTNAELLKLEVNKDTKDATVSPAFNPSMFDYTINIPNSVTSVNFTPTKGHAKQTIVGDLTVNIATDTIEHRLEVIAEDGATSKTYIFSIYRETSKSKDATLQSLTGTGGGTFSPTFNPEVTNYAYTVENTVESVTFSGVAAHPYAIVGGSGMTYDNLVAGNNGPYNITVIAEDKSVMKNYSITIKRKAADIPVTDKDWNFSEAPFGTVIEYSTETTLDELTLIPASDKTVKFTANPKSMDGFDFTHRLQLQGTGDPSKNAVKFNVTGTCKITVYGMAANGQATDRPLIINNGTAELFSEIILGDVLYKKEYNYTGNASDLYIYSGNSGINLYMIRVAY
jgi:hypothetical protein